MLLRLRTSVSRLRQHLWPQFLADGLAVNGRNLKFLAEESQAWDAVKRSNARLPGGVPDIRWRVHIAIWAARHAVKLPGDFVECGVFTAMFATAICNSLDLGQKRFWLFDTFEGIPLERVGEDERLGADHHNRTYYDLLNPEAVVRNALGDVPGVRIVKGLLPDTLSTVPELERISFLSVDLNNEQSEIAVAEALWDKLVPGAVVLLDDYGWASCWRQQQAWDTFAVARGHSIATLPTGQGLLIRS